MIEGGERFEMTWQFDGDVCGVVGTQFGATAQQLIALFVPNDVMEFGFLLGHKYLGLEINIIYFFKGTYLLPDFELGL